MTRNRKVLGIRLQLACSLMVVWLGLSLPNADAQQKKQSPAKAEAAQKLSDAYAVIVRFISSGTTDRRSESKRHDGFYQETVNGQLNVVARPDICAVTFDEREEDVSTDISEGHKELKHVSEIPFSYVIPLSLVDLQSLKTWDDPFKESEGMETTKNLGVKVNIGYIGIYKDWKTRYLKLPSRGPGGAGNFAPADLVYLRNQEEADRVIGALKYAAKTCGAKDSAF